MQTFKGGSFKSPCVPKRPSFLWRSLIPMYPSTGIPSGKTTVQVHYLKPMYYEEYKDMKSTEIAVEVQHRIEEVIAANSKKKIKFAYTVRKILIFF